MEKIPDLQKKLVLPPYYKYQQEVSGHPARFKVLAIGRRAGKSFFAKMESLDRAVNYNQNVWLVYPSFGTASPHFREVLLMTNEMPFRTYVNKQQRLIEFAGGGSIEFKSADRPDNLRGTGLDYVVLDEAAFINSYVFFSVIMPIVADRQGEILFISTPNGKNWFYNMYKQGESDHPDFNDWASWQLSSSANPKMTKKEMQTQRSILPQKIYRQEFLAKFEGTGGGAFVGVEEVATVEPLAGPIEGHSYTAGIDWGRVNDHTVFSVFDMNTGEQVFIDRFTDIGYEIQSDRIVRNMLKWKPKLTFIEVNSIGQPMFEKLTKDSLLTSMPSILEGVKPVYMTNKIKRRIIEKFAVYIESNNISLFTNKTLLGAEQIAELSVFERKTTHSGLQITYSAPKGYHDDIVMADALAAMGFARKEIQEFSSVPNIFYI